MLKKNFDIPMEESDKFNQSKRDEDWQIEEEDSEVGFGTKMEDLEATSPKVFGNLSPQALNYIQKLQSELSQAQEVNYLENSVFVQIIYRC